MLLVLTVITGIAYPLAVTGVAQAAFSHQANGSLGPPRTARSSAPACIGQNFDLPKKNPNDPNEAAQPDPKWFQPRPSAGSVRPARPPAPPTSARTTRTWSRRSRSARPRSPPSTASTRRTSPPTRVTASGSGLDPDISPAYADEQVDRVAKARGLDPAAVRKLVADNTHSRALGFLGEPYVNVLDLNLALTKTA